ncbi:hypothetical protein MASR2M74_26500 [Paracoccaceae bacterium]
MVEVLDMPENLLGDVPTPALVAPIEFTLRREDYAAMWGHVSYIWAIEEVRGAGLRPVPRDPSAPHPHDDGNYRWRRDAASGSS